MIEAASTFKHASQRLHATRSLGALFQALTADDLGGRSAPQKLTPPVRGANAVADASFTASYCCVLEGPEYYRCVLATTTD